MSIVDILQKGVAFSNADAAARAMLADFQDNRVGIQLDGGAVTLVIRNGVISLDAGMREDCHAAIRLKDIDMCGAIDDSFDLLEIRDRGEIIKGDRADPNLPVHFMAIFPLFEAMVRMYEQGGVFKNEVDALKASIAARA